MSANLELNERRTRNVPQGLSSFFPSIFTQRANNAEIWDVEGKHYIDFAAGIAVLNTGHLHEKVVASVKTQLKQFSHTCFQVTPYESYVALAERLNEVVPGTTPKKTLFLSTGAEAVENAIKIARVHTQRPGVIAFSGAFHGRTMMGMALTGKINPYKSGFGPFPPEIYHVPYPIPYHGVSISDSLKSLDNLFKADVDAKRIGAMIIEPVLGEGGFYIAPPEFLQRLRDICFEHDIVFIVDEIQTGFARTGKLFASEYAGIEPDIVTLAKGMAGGFPLSAVTGNATIMDAPQPGGLGGTYAGSPIACAAALAVLDIINEENLVTRANAIGTYLVKRLSEIAQKEKGHSIGEIRNLGAMVAIELVKDPTTREPDPDLAKTIVQGAAKKGLILLSCGIYANVIRILVPLTATDELIERGMDLLEEAFLEIVG